MNHPNKELSTSKEQDIDQILYDIKKTIISTSPNTDVLELTDKIEGNKKNESNSNIANMNNAIFKALGKDLGDNDYNFLKGCMNLINNKNSLDKQSSSPLRFQGDLTLEEVVIELLKQQLSDWLNNNLTSIVNDIVQKEIKKLIPKNE